MHKHNWIFVEYDSRWPERKGWKRVVNVALRTAIFICPCGLQKEVDVKERERG